MNPVELAFGAVLVPLLIGLAAYFAWRQIQTLRSLKSQPTLDPVERVYLRKQAWRRLVCCALMLLLAGLLAASYFQEGAQLAVSEGVRERRAQGLEPTEEQKTFLRQFALHWIAVLGVLFILLMLVAVDVWSIARFGMRARRKLQEDYREVLRDEIARLRGQRNGPR